MKCQISLDLRLIGGIAFCFLHAFFKISLKPSLKLPSQD